MNINSHSTFGIIGGDKRQLYAANSIYLDGCGVTVSGFDAEKPCEGIKNTSPERAALNSEIIILPLPAMRGGKIFSPLAEQSLDFSAALAKAVEGKKIFCGNAESLAPVSAYLNKSLIFDFLKREDFAVLNAVPTAEGALECAFHNYEGTLNGSRCLVCGYGRIGKILAYDLKMLGASVTVSARRSDDIAWIKANNFTPAYTDRLCLEKKFDIIFNTVPRLIFDSGLLAEIAPGALVIDLASPPGGVDFDACRIMGIKAIHALSLPGKSSPKTAGEIIKSTIFKMLEEEKN